MTQHSNSKEPASEPAPIPPLADIIDEGNRAIGAQARAAVASIMANGDFASPSQLRKWGPSGAKYFLEVLQKRIAERSQPRPTSAAATKRTRNHPSGDGKRNSAKSTKRERAPVSLDRDWASQQHKRWSTRTRAILQGLLVAAILFGGTAAMMRMWPSLVAAAKQKIQNRS